jgi:hypothetical protein
LSWHGILPANDTAQRGTSPNRGPGVAPGLDFEASDRTNPPQPRITNGKRALDKKSFGTRSNPEFRTLADFPVGILLPGRRPCSAVDQLTVGRLTDRNQKVGLVEESEPKVPFPRRFRPFAVVGNRYRDSRRIRPGPHSLRPIREGRDKRLRPGSEAGNCRDMESSRHVIRSTAPLT